MWDIADSGCGTECLCVWYTGGSPQTVARALERLMSATRREAAS